MVLQAMYIYMETTDRRLAPASAFFATFQEDTKSSSIQKRIWIYWQNHDCPDIPTDCRPSASVTGQLEAISKSTESTPLRSSAPKRTGILHRRRSATRKNVPASKETSTSGRRSGMGHYPAGSILPWKRPIWNWRKNFVHQRYTAL